MTIVSIGTGLKTALAGITTLRVFAPDEIPDALPELPALVILPPKISYHITYDEKVGLDFRALLLFTKQDQPSALSAMLPYLETTGSYSIKAAIESERTLGGVADDVIVKTSSGSGYTTWGGTTYLSSEFEIYTLGGY